MFSLIGIVVVFGSIAAGFLMEKGNLLVLIQPAELIIIGGAAVATVLVANPLPLALKVFKSALGALAGSRFTKDFYLETLKMLNDIFTFARKSGMAKLEEDVENPAKSAVFSKFKRPSPGWWRRTTSTLYLKTISTPAIAKIRRRRARWRR